MLRFSSEEEALQYLSDATNKTVKIAGNSNSFDSYVEVNREEDVEVTVNFDYIPEEVGTFNSPHFDAEVEITTVFREDTGEDVVDELSRDQMELLENEAFENIEKKIKEIY